MLTSPKGGEHFCVPGSVRPGLPSPGFRGFPQLLHNPSRGFARRMPSCRPFWYHGCMVRTQVQLTEEQQNALRDLSAATGRSVSDLVRDAVERAISGAPHVTRREQVEKALRLAGRFASGSSDISAHHDEYLAEAHR